MPGRSAWPNRDPLGEQGGINLYGFVRNDAINNYDILGDYNNPIIQFVPNASTGLMGNMANGNYWLAIEFRLDPGTAMISKVTQNAKTKTCSCPQKDNKPWNYSLYSFTTYDNLWQFGSLEAIDPMDTKNMLDLALGETSFLNSTGIMTITLEYAIIAASPIPNGFPPILATGPIQGQHAPSTTKMPPSWPNYSPKATYTFTVTLNCDGTADTTASPEIFSGDYRWGPNGPRK